MQPWGQYPGYQGPYFRPYRQKQPEPIKAIIALFIIFMIFGIVVLYLVFAQPFHGTLLSGHGIQNFNGTVNETKLTEEFNKSAFPIYKDGLNQQRFIPFCGVLGSAEANSSRVMFTAGNIVLASDKVTIYIYSRTLNTDNNSMVSRIKTLLRCAMDKVKGIMINNMSLSLMDEKIYTRWTNAPGFDSVPVLVAVICTLAYIQFRGKVHRKS